MDICEELEKVSLPVTYYRNSKKCFLDPYRKRLIEITPEEIVRQRMANYCETILGIPADHIFLEVPMSHYVDGAPGRADIIVHAPIDEYTMRPVLIIECKKNDVVLSDKVMDQAITYCDITAADYFIITNGREIEIFKYIENEKRYRKLEQMLTYQEMIHNKGAVVQDIPKGKRLSFEQLHDLELLEEYNESDAWVYGADTPTKMRPFIVNLYEGLMDEEHLLPKAKFDNYELVQDLGTRFLDYSNAGAGHFYGRYRSFLIQERNKDSQIISFSIFGTANSAPLDKVNTKRKSYSSLAVAIDKFKTSKMILEYNIDTYVSLSGDDAKFAHNGRISSLSSKELREYISENSQLIEFQNDEMKLGQIEMDQLITLDDNEVSKLMYSFIEYALLRERYRSSKKK